MLLHQRGARGNELATAALSSAPSRKIGAAGGQFDTMRRPIFRPIRLFKHIRAGKTQGPEIESVHSLAQLTGRFIVQRQHGWRCRHSASDI